MSNRLFSATGAVWHCGPKRVKRTWRTTVCNVLMLLALAALTGWLWGCVKHAAMPAPVRIPGVAVAPLSQGMVIGVLISLSTMGIVLAVRKMARDDAEAAEGRDLASPAPCEDPLALPAVGMSREDLARILAAMIAEATEARGLIESEMDGLGVETWEERLARAQRCIHGVVLCLGNLADRCTIEAVDSIDDPDCPEYMPDVNAMGISDSWLADDDSIGREALECQDGIALRFTLAALLCGEGLRPYFTPAAGHKPSHGGRVA